MKKSLAISLFLHFFIVICIFWIDVDVTPKQKPVPIKLHVNVLPPKEIKEIVPMPVVPEKPIVQQPEKSVDVLKNVPPVPKPAKDIPSKSVNAKDVSQQPMLQKKVDVLKNKTEADLEIRHKAEEDAKRKAEVEARQKAEEDAKRKVEAEARQKAEEEAKRKAEAEARQKAEAEAKRKAEIARLNGLRQAYIEGLRMEIEKYKKYPVISKAKEEEGKAVIVFRVMKNGKIVDARLKTSSSFEKLDEAALKALERVGIFKPIPMDLNEEFLDITLPISFKIR